MRGPTPRQWTEAEDTRLIRYFNDGEYTVQQIAYTLGRPAGSVRARLGKLRKEGRVGHKKAPTRFAKKESTNEPVAEEGGDKE